MDNSIEQRLFEELNKPAEWDMFIGEFYTSRSTGGGTEVRMVGRTSDSRVCREVE